jgi:hypothetical protein
MALRIDRGRAFSGVTIDCQHRLHDDIGRGLAIGGAKGDRIFEMGIVLRKPLVRASTSSRRRFSSGS